jgi:hypothetical protein
VNDQQHRVADCPHHELAVGWALHALEPAGASLVTVHMPTCPVCTRTAAATEKVGATLGLSVLQANPSAELEQRGLRVTGAKWEAPIVALAPSPRPARHITKRSWLHAWNWLRPRR